MFHRPIKAKVENEQKYSLALIALHNYLQQTHNVYYCPNGFIDCENFDVSLKEGMWRDIVRGEGVAELQEIRNVRGSRYQQSILAQREALKDYFMNENILSWQLEHVRSCGPILQG